MRHTHANLLLLGCAAIWGFGYLFQKSAMAHVGPLLFVGARCGLAAIVLVPFAWAEHRRATAPCTLAFAGLAMLAGVLLAIASIVQQTGIIAASVTNAAFLTSLYVVATPLLAWPLLRQTPSRHVWLSVVASFLGAWMLGGGGFTAFGRGELLVLVATLLWATHVVVLGRAAVFERPVLLTACQFAIASAIGLAGAFAAETVDPAALRRAFIDIAYVGIFSSALTFTIFAAALRRTTAAEATVIASAEALFAALGAYLWLGERLTTIGAGGAALIFLAAVAVQLSGLRRSA